MSVSSRQSAFEHFVCKFTYSEQTSYSSCFTLGAVAQEVELGYNNQKVGALIPAPLSSDCRWVFGQGTSPTLPRVSVALMCDCGRLVVV